MGGGGVLLGRCVLDLMGCGVDFTAEASYALACYLCLAGRAARLHSVP